MGFLVILYHSHVVNGFRFNSSTSIKNLTSRAWPTTKGEIEEHFPCLIKNDVGNIEPELFYFTKARYFLIICCLLLHSNNWVRH